MGGKVQRIRSIIGRHKVDREVENSVGNGESKEVICRTHGHQLSGGGMLEVGGREEGDKGDYKIERKKRKDSAIWTNQTVTIWILCLHKNGPIRDQGRCFVY